MAEYTIHCHKQQYKLVAGDYEAHGFRPASWEDRVVGETPEQAVMQWSMRVGRGKVMLVLVRDGVWKIQ